MTSSSLKLATAALLLAVLGVVRAQSPQDYIDNSNGNPENWVTSMFYTMTADDGSQVVVSGPDGCFANDGDNATPDQTAGEHHPSVCADRLATFNQSSPTSFCMRGNDTALNGSMWKVTCTGAGDSTDNVLSQCKVGYAPVSPCYPANYTSAAAVTSSGFKGKCSMMGKPFSLQDPSTGTTLVSFADYEKLPCRHFPDPPSGEKRFYCVGNNTDHLLMCPDNVLRNCTGGCTTKVELNGTHYRQCGKAACGLPPSAPPSSTPTFTGGY